MSDPVLIMAAPNGARRSKADHPALPITHEEIIAEAVRCYGEGAGMVHVHVRDSQGRHLLDADAYRAVIAGAARAVGPDLLIQATTEAAGRYETEAQIALVEALKPAAVSLALREILPEAHTQPARQEAEARAARLFAFMRAEGVWPQFILYEPQEVIRLRALIERGVVPYQRPFLLFVLGQYQHREAEPGDLEGFLEALGDLRGGAAWMICAFGKAEHACARKAMAEGGHVRVGFENNLHLPGGRLAPSTAALVALAREAAEESGRPVMTAEELQVLRQAGL